jgi:hypothetical protein
MRTIPVLLFAGGAALAAAAAVAATSAPRTHVLTITFPSGAVERFTYAGDAPPRVSLDSAAVPLADAASWDMSAPFADLDRMAAQMDREMAGLRKAMVSGVPNGLQTVGLSGMPAGAESYSVVSTISGGRACTRSVEVTSQGAGQAPRVVSQTSGDCGGPAAAPSAPTPSATPAASRTQI